RAAWRAAAPGVARPAVPGGRGAAPSPRWFASLRLRWPPPRRPHWSEGARAFPDQPMKRRVEKLTRRAQRTTPIRVLVAYGESRASNYALGLAFAAILSIVPIMLGALSIGGARLR